LAQVGPTKTTAIVWLISFPAMATQTITADAWILKVEHGSEIRRLKVEQTLAEELTLEIVRSGVLQLFSLLRAHVDTFQLRYVDASGESCLLTNETMPDALSLNSESRTLRLQAIVVDVDSAQQQAHLSNDVGQAGVDTQEVNLASHLGGAAACVSERFDKTTPMQKAAAVGVGLIFPAIGIVGAGTVLASKAVSISSKRKRNDDGGETSASSGNRLSQVQDFVSGSFANLHGAARDCGGQFAEAANAVSERFDSATRKEKAAAVAAGIFARPAAVLAGGAILGARAAKSAHRTDAHATPAGQSSDAASALGTSAPSNTESLMQPVEALGSSAQTAAGWAAERFEKATPMQKAAAVGAGVLLPPIGLLGAGVVLGSRGASFAGVPPAPTEEPVVVG